MLIFALSLACATTPALPPAAAADAVEAPPATSSPTAPSPAANPAPTETPAPAAVPLLPADKDAGITGRCADGQVVFPFWPGEYPLPVVQLDTEVTTRVALDPCGPVTHACAISPGLYHPWSQEEHASPSALGFSIRRGVDVRKVLESGTYEDVTLEAGGTLEVLTYLGEGYCMLRVDGVVREAWCPDDDPRWPSSGEDLPETQLMEVRCTGEERPYWLPLTDAFQALPGVGAGRVVGYGDVLPASDDPDGPQGL